MRRKLRRIPGLGGRGLYPAFLSEPFHDGSGIRTAGCPAQRSLRYQAVLDLILSRSAVLRGARPVGCTASRTGVPDEFILPATRIVWRLGERGGRVCLGAAERRPGLATLYSRSLGEHRPIWLVLGVRRALRLGDVSLRSMGFFPRCRLVLGSGTRWAPAWVAWRGSDDYVGWAPLPPASDGLNVSINIGSVPDHYWQVVPARSFLDVNLSAWIVRDDSQFRPVFARTRPLGNVTIVNNVVVNNVVNIQYVEQRTRRKVVRAARRGGWHDRRRRAKFAGKAGRVFPPPHVVVRPPRVRRLQEIAAYSKTKGQALNEPATGPMAFHKKLKSANLGGPAALACTGGKVLIGNQCRCPPGMVGNGQGVCLSPAQLAARRAALQAGGVQQCTGGKVLIGNQCRCPRGMVGNGQGVCRQPGAARCPSGGPASRRGAAMHRRQGAGRQPVSLPARHGRQRSRRMRQPGAARCPSGGAASRRGAAMHRRQGARSATSVAARPAWSATVKAYASARRSSLPVGRPCKPAGCSNAPAARCSSATSVAVRPAWSATVKAYASARRSSLPVGRPCKPAGCRNAPAARCSIGNQCRCPPGMVGNGQGVCVSAAQLAARRAALQAGGAPQCTGGKVLIGNQCRCPPGMVGNGQGVCVNAAQLAARRAALQAGGVQQCTGGKVLIGNQCRCPPAWSATVEGVCVSAAQLAARRAALQAGGVQQCTGGKVLIGNQCRCPPGMVGNGRGVCTNVPR